MFGEVIKKYRKERNLTQRELAEKAGLSVRAITEIERGERNGRPKTLEKIFNVLGIEVILKDRLADKNTPNRFHSEAV
jgi:transcriptional regulator with XRE-family HTH domain